MTRPGAATGGGNYRPTDWQPLDHGSDPVPGDPDEVEGEAKYYSNVATEISSQVSRLRRLADPDSALTGDYSEALQKSCEELAGHMERAHGRFETTGDELAKLHGPLYIAQTDTRSALDAAIDAKGDVQSGDDENYTKAEMADVDNVEAHAAGRKMDQGEQDLAAAKKKCNDAVSHFDGIARGIASKIKAASDDDMKDGRFDGLKSWIKDHAAMLKAISKILGAIALIVAIAIILISNPAGWLILIAALSSIALLAVDSALAWAGEGSWTDVAFDVVGVATLGAGSVFGKMARFGRSASLLKAGNSRGISAARSSFRAATHGKGLLGRVGGLFNRARPSTYTNAARAYKNTFNQVRNFPLVKNGSKFTMYSDDMTRMTREFGSGSITGLQRSSVSMLHANDVASKVNLGAGSFYTHGMSNIPGLDQVKTKVNDATTREVHPLW